jgi:cation diffusion facilitator family transporter
MPASLPSSASIAARKKNAAFWSIIASLGLTLGKGVAAIATGSLALLSEAAHGLVDVAATTLTYFAVQAADKPADDEHHYGHGKIEALAALIETAVLFALAGWVIFEAVTRLFVDPHDITPAPLAFIVLILSIAVDAWRWRALSKVARETRSDALAADALHFSSDLVSSALALIGLIGIFYGFKQADSLAAMGVAIFIAIAGWRLARRTLDTLLDAAPKGFAQRIEALTAAIPGVVGVTNVRVRPVGGVIMSDVSVDVARTLPLDRVTEMRQRIISAIQQDMPEAEVNILVAPRALDDETVLERILLIAAKRRVPVHHVTVQNIEGRLSISLDLEVDARLSLGAAHMIASKFEAAIRDELGPDIEVETHIEPLIAFHLEGQNAAPEEISAIERLMQDMARQDMAMSHIHSVRVRRSDNGLVVNYHCCFPAQWDVATTHRHVDALERRLRERRPDIIRVVGHAEPLSEAEAKEAH